MKQRYIFYINEPGGWCVITPEEHFLSAGYIHDNARSQVLLDHDLYSIGVYDLDESTFEYECDADTLRQRLTRLGMSECQKLKEFCEK